MSTGATEAHQATPEPRTPPKGGGSSSVAVTPRTLTALKDAAAAMPGLRQENERLRRKVDRLRKKKGRSSRCCCYASTSCLILILGLIGYCAMAGSTAHATTAHGDAAVKLLDKAAEGNVDGLRVASAQKVDADCLNQYESSVPRWLMLRYCSMGTELDIDLKRCAPASNPARARLAPLDASPPTPTCRAPKTPQNSTTTQTCPASPRQCNYGLARSLFNDVNDKGKLNPQPESNATVSKLNFARDAIVRKLEGASGRGLGCERDDLRYDSCLVDSDKDGTVDATEWYAYAACYTQPLKQRCYQLVCK